MKKSMDSWKQPIQHRIYQVLIIHSMKTSSAPQLGQSFGSIQDAYKFYESYAIEIGFNVSKGISTVGKDKVSKEKIIMFKSFICWKEGFSRAANKTMINDNAIHDDSDDYRFYKEERRVGLSRTGCKAFMSVTFRSDLKDWVVSHF